jgi:TolB-like protein
MELAALRLLLANAGQVVIAAQLKRALWGNVHVTADSVTKCLSSLRSRLHPDDCIQTVYKRGYRLISEVRPQSVSLTQSLPRLAIPPFVTHLGVPDHLGSAIAEEAIARLSNAPSPPASILARDSVFTLAKRGFGAQQIGESLNADLILTGTLRALTSHFRLRVEMIRVADGVQLWAEDLLVARDKIAGLESCLAASLEFRLQTRALDLGTTSHSAPDSAVDEGRIATSSTKRKTSSRSHTPSVESVPATGAPTDWSADVLAISAAAVPASESAFNSPRREAYEAFLRGRHEWQAPERHRMQDALQHLIRATELDPSLIAAKVELVNLCVNQAYFGYMSTALAAELVHRTVDSIPDFPAHAQDALPALAWIKLHFDRDLSAALSALGLCAHLPHSRSITRARSMFALSRHHFSEAIGLLRAAIELDPFSPWLHSRLAWALHLDGQAAASVQQIEHALRLFPELEGARFYGAMILAYNGDAPRAVEIAEELVQHQPYFDAGTAVLAYALARAGRVAESSDILERLHWLGRERFILKSFNIAVCVALGDLDRAMSEFRAANQERCPWFFQMLADPRLEPLCAHPEFAELQAVLPRMEAAARHVGEA